MKSLICSLLPAALGAAALLAPAATSPLGGGPILTGDCIVLPPSGEPNGIELTLVERGNGGMTGHGMQFNVVTGSEIEFDITSYEFVGDILCVAGPIVTATNAAPPFEIGNTVIYCVLDNGNGGSSVPDSVAAGAGPPGLTVQDILALAGPPPPGAFAPVEMGNLKIH